MIKLVWFLAACAVVSLAQADGDGKQWYANQFSCWGKNYVLRNYCENEPDRAVNKRCDSEELVLDPDGKRKVVDLNRHEPYKGDIFWVGSVTCGEIENKKYFYLQLDNGGNCDECEMSATLRSDGTWVHAGDKWLVPKAMKKKILRARSRWLTSPTHAITNKT